MSDITNAEPATADLLDQSAMALAGYAAERLLGHASGAKPTNGQFHWWQSYLASRVKDLAAAVHLGRPEMFIRQVQWCRDALTAKALPTEQFVRALDALAAVIEAELDGSGERISRAYVRAAIDQLPTDGAAPDVVLDGKTTTNRLAAAYVLAILEGDRRRAAKLVHDAIDSGLDPHDAYLQVLVPACHEIGRMWHQDEVSIAEEHFGTATTVMVMGQLLDRYDTPKPNGKAVLVASVTGDRHALGIHVVADFFEMDGWRVVYLGPDIPASELPQAATDFEADLLLLSATMYAHLRTMEHTIRAVRRATEPTKLPILVGGAAFGSDPAVAKQIGADGFAGDARQAVAEGRKLVGLG